MDAIHLTREEMLHRVATFESLTRSQGGFPDSDIEGCARVLMNVLGYERPDQIEGEQMTSPVGDKATEASAIPVSEGINIGFVECTPGNGVMTHNHDTNETFTVISGQWRFTWNDEDDQFIELGPLDTVSFPPGLERRFTNLASNDGGDGPSLLLVAVAGNQPGAWFRKEFLEAARVTGKYTPQVDRQIGLEPHTLAEASK